MRVAFFVTCLVDFIRPQIGFAALKLLKSAGYQVEVPPTQTCCSQPAYNAGCRRAASSIAEKVLNEFENFDAIVVPSGSCAGMMKIHYLHLFQDNPQQLARAKTFSAKVYELTDFLVNVAKIKSIDNCFHATVTYHDSCSGLRELKVKSQPRALLKQVRGLQLKEMEDCQTCCGFGGTFSVKYGDISAKLADEKCQHIRDTKADAVILGDLGCILQIEGRLRRLGDHKTKVLHIAQALTTHANSSDSF